MISPTELHDEWTDGDEPGVRPQRVQRLRTAIRTHTDYTPPRRIESVKEWLDEHAADVADDLESAAEAESNESDDTETADDPDDSDGGAADGEADVDVDAVEGPVVPDTDEDDE